MDRCLYFALLGAFIPQAGLPDLIRASINTRSTEKDETCENDSSQEVPNTEDELPAISLPVQKADFRTGKTNNSRTLNLRLCPDRFLSDQSLPIGADLHIVSGLIAKIRSIFRDSNRFFLPRARVPGVMIHGPPAG